MAMSAVMSCLRSCARRRAGASSSATLANGRGHRTARKSRSQIEEPEQEPAGEVPLELDAERIVARTQGRERWLREGKRQLEQHRWENPDPVARSRCERLVLAGERLAADLDVERRANEALRRIGRRDGCTTDGGSAARPSRTRRRSCRPGR